MSIAVHLVSLALGVASIASEQAAAPLEIVTKSSGSWPWIAIGGLVFLVGAIALAARRILPFGKSR
jgi:hypothetical protein